MSKKSLINFTIKLKNEIFCIDKIFIFDIKINKMHENMQKFIMVNAHF